MKRANILYTSWVIIFLLSALLSGCKDNPTPPKAPTQSNNSTTTQAGKVSLETPTPVDTRKLTEVEVLYNKAGELYLNKKLKEAIKTYSKAIELDERFIEAYLGRGSVYAVQLRFEEAFSDFDKAVELNPKHPVAYYNKGLAYELLDDKDKAIEFYNIFLELAPEHKTLEIEKTKWRLDIIKRKKLKEEAEKKAEEAKKK